MGEKKEGELNCFLSFRNACCVTCDATRVVYVSVKLGYVHINTQCSDFGSCMSEIKAAINSREG